MVPVAALAAGGWWVGLSVASVLIAVLAALVVTVITLVNRIELRAASITDGLTATGECTRPLLDLVEVNFHLDTISKGGRSWPTRPSSSGSSSDRASQRVRELRS